MSHCEEQTGWPSQPPDSLGPRCLAACLLGMAGWATLPPLIGPVVNKDPHPLSRTVSVCPVGFGAVTH